MSKSKLFTTVRDFTINQGDDFRFQIVVKTSDDKPINITGYEFKCRVRKSAEDEEVVISAKTSIVDGAKGIVEFHFKDEDTSQIDTDGDTYAETNEYTYDVLMRTPDGEVTRLLNGMFYVSPGISWH